MTSGLSLVSLGLNRVFWLQLVDSWLWADACGVFIETDVGIVSISLCQALMLTYTISTFAVDACYTCQYYLHQRLIIICFIIRRILIYVRNVDPKINCVETKLINITWPHYEVCLNVVYKDIVVASFRCNWEAVAIYVPVCVSLGIPVKLLYTPALCRYVNNHFAPVHSAFKTVFSKSEIKIFSVFWT